MPLPSAAKIGLAVQYLPGPFDAFAYNYGTPGPVAALITYVNTNTGSVNLVIFRDGKEPTDRAGILYRTDAQAADNSFRLLTDPATPPPPSEPLP